MESSPKASLHTSCIILFNGKSSGGYFFSRIAFHATAFFSADIFFKSHFSGLCSVFMLLFFILLFISLSLLEKMNLCCSYRPQSHNLGLYFSRMDRLNSSFLTLYYFSQACIDGPHPTLHTSHQFNHLPSCCTHML